ncbi:hypothetical protein [Shimia aestuarii]|uniref:hypothetical protein n=1 Tax=Shimia aestuarii TaxID=254406 RepID=UPI001FB309A5|nr:hypothetical protein [Shimia aestuarii]
MKLKNRLETLEKKALEVSTSQGDAKKELHVLLSGMAERVRGTSLDDLLVNPSPMLVLALFLDGRINDRLVELITEFAGRSGPVGSMCKSILELQHAS